MQTPRDLVAEHLLLQLPPLLRFERQCSGGSGDQAAEADGFAGFVTETVLTRLDAAERLRNLLEKLSFPVARAQLERVLLLDGRAVGRIRHDRRVLAKVLRGLAGVAEQVVLE